MEVLPTLLLLALVGGEALAAILGKGMLHSNQKLNYAKECVKTE